MCQSKYSVSNAVAGEHSYTFRYERGKGHLERKLQEITVAYIKKFIVVLVVVVHLYLTLFMCLGGSRES